MPAPVTEHQIAEMLALYDAGKSKGEARESAGIGKTTAARIFRELRPNGSNPSERFADLHAERLAEAESIAAAAREDAVNDLKKEFRLIVALATERIKECMRSDAEPNAVQMQTARWAIDKLVSSADAREQNRADLEAARAYGEMMRDLTAEDPERDAKAVQVETVQDQVVEDRQRYIATEPD